MSAERIVPCQFNPLIDCEAQCTLYSKGSQFVSEFSEGFEIPESAVAEKLRAQFSMLDPREQDKLIKGKITILGEKQIDQASCMKFDPPQSK